MVWTCQRCDVLNERSVDLSMVWISYRLDVRAIVWTCERWNGRVMGSTMAQRSIGLMSRFWSGRASVGLKARPMFWTSDGLDDRSA
jgi:hypothetical protein